MFGAIKCRAGQPWAGYNTGVEEVAAGAAIVGVLGSLWQGQQSRNLASSTADRQLTAAQEAAARADPFREHRGQYADMLDQLMHNPNILLTSPVYEAEQEAGLSAVNRSAGARGLLGGGGRLTALQDYGSGLTADLFFNYASLLSQLSGATVNPAAGAGIYAEGTAGAANTALRGSLAANDLYGQAISQGLFGASLYGQHSQFGYGGYGQMPTLAQVQSGAAPGVPVGPGD